MSMQFFSSTTTRAQKVLYGAFILLIFVSLAYGALYVMQLTDTAEKVPHGELQLPDGYEQNTGLNDPEQKGLSDDSGIPLAGMLFASARRTVRASSTDTVVGFRVSEVNAPLVDWGDPSVFLPNGLQFFDKTSNRLFALTAATPNSFALASSVVPYLHVFESTSAQSRQVKKVFTAAKGGSVTGAVASVDQTKIAYSHLKDESVQEKDDVYHLDQWETVVLDYETGSVLMVIDHAVWPQWVGGENKLLLLKQDGLYVYDLTISKEQKIIGADPLPGTELKLNTQTKFKLTADGRYVVVTSPYMNRIEIFEVDSFDLLRAHSVGRITTKGTGYYTPVISPFGTQYAVLAVDEGGKNARIEIRPLLGRQVLYSKKLSNEFSPYAFVLNDWLAPPQL